MLYRTRHLEALRDIPHGSEFVPAGRRFHATEVDADYYITRKQAKDVPAEAPAAPAVEAPAAPVEAQPEPAAEPAPRRRTLTARTPPAEA